MKRLLAVMMCMVFVFCASCGKKAQPPVPAAQPAAEPAQSNEIENATSEIDKAIAEDPLSIEQGDIDAAKETTAQLKEELEGKIGTVSEEDAEEFMNQQAAVAIMEQGLAALEAATASGDEDAIKDAQNMINMAQDLWGFQQTE